MSYFRNVYLPRLNRFGTNLQERIINKKEYDFHNFVKKSPNRVTVFMQDFQFEGVLQTKTYDEIETIDYFLCYKTIPIPTGTILKVRSIRDKDKYTYWIVICKDNFVSAGYDRYTVVKLDREIRWITKEGYLFKALVHISGAGASALGKRITSSFRVTNESVVYNPNQNLTITMQDHEEIKRGARVTINNQVWKVSGYDNISNEGVSYVTLEQDYYDEKLDTTRHLPEDREPSGQDGIASGEKLDRWTFDSNLREEHKLEEQDGKPINTYTVHLNVGDKIPVDFRANYYNKPTDATITAKTLDNSIAEYLGRELYAKKVGETELIVRLADYPDIEKTIKLIVQNNEKETFSVEGPARLKYGFANKLWSDKAFEYMWAEKSIKNVDEVGNVTYDWDESSKEDLSPKFTLVNVSQNSNKFEYEIYCSEIIENVRLTFQSEDGDIYYKIVSVESPWIGGR